MENNNEPKMPFIEREVLEKVRFGLQERLCPTLLKNMQFSIEDEMANIIMYRIDLELLAKRVHEDKRTMTVPSSWWQHFKESVFPRWLQRKFPVRFTPVIISRTTYNICPHNNIAFDPKLGNNIHFAFMRGIEINDNQK